MSYTKKEIVESLSALDQLILYRKLAKNDLLNKIKRKLIKEDSKQNFNFSQVINELVDFNERLGLKGDIFRNYVKGIFINDQNSFSLAAEKNTIAENSSLYQLAINDLAIINQVVKIKFSDLIRVFNLESYSFLSPYHAHQINKRNLKIYNSILDGQYNIKDSLKNINNFIKNLGLLF